MDAPPAEVRLLSRVKGVCAACARRHPSRQPNTLLIVDHLSTGSVKVAAVRRDGGRKSAITPPADGALGQSRVRFYPIEGGASLSCTDCGAAPRVSRKAAMAKARDARAAGRQTFPLG